MVDTNIWSEVFRKTKPNVIVREVLIELIVNRLVLVCGPVRQELLSGIKESRIFENIKKSMRSFDDIEITTADFEKAAEFNNTCRKNGIQGSHTDFLLCALASKPDITLLTLDKDFEHYSRFVNFNLQMI